MLMLFRTRRTRELMRNSDAVSFDSFTNDYGDNNRTQESSLSSQSESRSPAKVRIALLFAPQNYFNWFSSTFREISTKECLRNLRNVPAYPALPS